MRKTMLALILTGSTMMLPGLAAPAQARVAFRVGTGFHAGPLQLSLVFGQPLYAPRAGYYYRSYRPISYPGYAPCRDCYVDNGVYYYDRSCPAVGAYFRHYNLDPDAVFSRYAPRIDGYSDGGYGYDNGYYGDDAYYDGGYYPGYAYGPSIGFYGGFGGFDRFGGRGDLRFRDGRRFDGNRGFHDGFRGGPGRFDGGRHFDDGRHFDGGRHFEGGNHGGHDGGHGFGGPGHPSHGGANHGGGNHGGGGHGGGHH